MVDFLGSSELLGKVWLACFSEILVLKITLRKVKLTNLWLVCSLKYEPE